MVEIDPMAAHETFRTEARQKELIEDGSSMVVHSNHQDGIAADLHFTNGVAFPPAGDDRWIRAAEVAKKHGIDCGGILWAWDWNHFQLEEQQSTLDEWQENALEWAVSNGVSNGERPLENITRVEVMEMFRKFSLNMLK